MATHCSEFALGPSPSECQEFWMRLLSYIMETDCRETLTPICVSLTNLAMCQLHDSDQEAGVAGKRKHGGQ